MADDQALDYDDWVNQVCGVDPRSYSCSADDPPEPEPTPPPPPVAQAKPVLGPPDDRTAAAKKLQPQGPQVSTLEPEVCDGSEPEEEPSVCEGDPAPPQAPAPPPDDGEGVMSPLHSIWEEGYEAGFASPDEDHPAPIPYSEEASRAYEAGVKKGKAEAEPQAPPAPAPQPPGPSTTLNPSPVGPVEEPASQAIQGVPAFRYNLPEIPVGSAELPTPAGLFILSLSLRGSVTVTFPNPPPGVSTDVNNQGWRLEAANAVGPVTSGIRVNGIGTGQPSIGAIMGTQYAIMETRFTPPSTMSFLGQAKFDYTRPSQNFGKVAVKGLAGFELRVTFIPSPPPPEPIDDSDGWWDKVKSAAAVVGTGVIVIVAIVGAPETEGGSLLLLETVK